MKLPADVQLCVWNDRSVLDHHSRINAQLRPGASLNRKRLEALSDGLPLHCVEDRNGRLQISFQPGQGRLTRLLERVRELNKVEWAEPELLHRACLTPTVDRFPDQWAHPAIGSPQAWEVTTGDPSAVGIGIIDSGISLGIRSGKLNHPDLRGSARFILGRDYISRESVRDVSGHGTAIAGLIAASGRRQHGIAGMNWHSDIYVCRTLDEKNSGTPTDFSRAVKEIVHWSRRNKTKVVINYPVAGDDCNVLREACKYADDSEVLICCAAGNDGSGVLFPAAYSAKYPSVVAVAATGIDDDLWPFSNYGEEITVSAPGVAVLHTTPPYRTANPAMICRYDCGNGTSLAAAIVSGLASLIWSVRPDLTNTQVKSILIETATGPYKRVDAAAALRLVARRVFGTNLLSSRN